MLHRRIELHADADRRSTDGRIDRIRHYVSQINKRTERCGCGLRGLREQTRQICDSGIHVKSLEFHLLITFPRPGVRQENTNPTAFQEKPLHRGVCVNFMLA